MHVKTMEAKLSKQFCYILTTQQHEVSQNQGGAGAKTTLIGWRRMSPTNEQS